MNLSRVLIMNGPNLDMLGMREPEIYGSDTLESLERTVVEFAALKGVDADCFQSNCEGKLIKKIHSVPKKYDAVIYNPGAHTHYSYAIRDAIGSVDTPFVEVHISDVNEREPFRAKSVTAPACVAQIVGRGFKGYCDAVDLLLELEFPVRLGEGYETRYPHGQVIVASENGGAAQVEMCSSDVNLDSAEEGAQSADAETQPAAEVLPKAFLQALSDQEPLDKIGASDGSLAKSSASRILKLIEKEHELGVDAFLVRDTSNIFWLTAIDNVFDTEQAHGLLVSPDNIAIHTDSRYGNAFREASERMGSSLEVNEDVVSHATFARDCVTSAGMNSFGAHANAPASIQLGIEDEITLGEYNKMTDSLASSNVESVPTHGVVFGLRSVKDDGEIARMKAAQSITDAAFEHIVGFMERGMTERAIQIELEDFMIRHGAKGLAFSSIVASGINGANPHAIPGDDILDDGMSVVMDFGARAFGYCSDMTRTVFIGEPTDEMQRAWDTVRLANESVEAMLAPGVTGAEAHALAEAVLASGGFAGKMGHGLGHGVGIDIHELPSLSPRNDLPLVAGNIVTVEPGIYLPGKFGMRLEDFGVITPDGFDVFTKSTHEMVIL